MNAQPKSLREEVLRSLLKQGIGWTLFVALVFVIGYKVNQVADAVTPKCVAYIETQQQTNHQNAENVEALMESQVQASEEHITMIRAQKEITEHFTETLKNASEERLALLQSCKVVQESLATREDEHKLMAAQLKEIVGLIQAAGEMMKDVPDQRDQMIKLLGEIKAGIDKLVLEAEQPTP